jgi:hypothetical protein
MILKINIRIMIVFFSFHLPDDWFVMGIARENLGAVATLITERRNEVKRIFKE